MRDIESAASFAIAQAKRRHRAEIGADELLLGCLQTMSQFGVVQLGAWTFDLEELGVDWLEHPERATAKVAYSEAAVKLFDRASQIAKTEGAKNINVSYLLAAFAPETEGLMGQLKGSYGITSGTWRAAVAQYWSGQLEREAIVPTTENRGATVIRRDYLTPEEAAEALGIHVQTMRAYVRSGKLPALRLAGERAIRIRREDLEGVLEPLVPET